MIESALVLAQQSPQAPPSIGLQFLFPMFVVFMILYFVWLRPQKKKEQERADMLASLKKNDRVVTAGGIHGVVVSAKEKVVVLRVDDEKKIKLTFNRTAISRILEESPGENST